LVRPLAFARAGRRWLTEPGTLTTRGSGIVTSGVTNFANLLVFTSLRLATTRYEKLNRLRPFPCRGNRINHVAVYRSHRLLSSRE
jgi:hypothetical protein